MFRLDDFSVTILQIRFIHMLGSLQTNIDPTHSSFSSFKKQNMEVSYNRGGGTYPRKSKSSDPDSVLKPLVTLALKTG